MIISDALSVLRDDLGAPLPLDRGSSGLLADVADVPLCDRVGGDGVTALDPARVQAVLCDVDGNLLPSEEPVFVASADVANRFLAEHGVHRRYTAEQLRLATTGMDFRSTALARAWRLPVDAAVLDGWVEREEAELTAHLRTVLRPDPAVLDPLTRLAGSYEVAAVSSSADARTTACFEVTGLAGFFPPQRRFSAEDSLPRPTGEPDPAIYRHALAQMGLDPEEAVAVEDSVPGATSAVAAGIPTIGNLQFTPPGEREDRRRALTGIGVAAVVADWDEVVDVLLDPGRSTAREPAPAQGRAGRARRPLERARGTRGRAPVEAVGSGRQVGARHRGPFERRER